MSERRGRRDRGPGLFDLPLRPDPDAPAPDPLSKPITPAPADDDELDEALAGESLFDDPMERVASPPVQQAEDTEDDDPAPPLTEPVARAPEPSAPTALSLFPELDEELERGPDVVETAPEDEPEQGPDPVSAAPSAPVRDFEPVTPAAERSPGPRAVPDLEDDDPEPEEIADPEERSEPRVAPLGVRLAAGLTDLAVLGAVTAVLWLGSRALGVDPAAALPALGLFLLLFSAIYTIIPLAFWGGTPGMSRAGLVARGDHGEPLTFGQTARRWLGGILTAALLGLPMLLALGEGGSLTDRLSRSVTFET